MECWDCDAWHADEEAAIRIHDKKRSDIVQELEILMKDRRVNPEKAKTVSMFREQIDEQERILSWLRINGEIPSRRVEK